MGKRRANMLASQIKDQFVNAPQEIRIDFLRKNDQACESEANDLLQTLATFQQEFGQLTSLFTANAYKSNYSTKDQSDPPTPRDVIDEIFDMVQPQHPGYITLDDLLKSGHEHTVLAILTDANCFMQHENCELRSFIPHLSASPHSPSPKFNLTLFTSLNYAPTL
nr:hypothetical transcript [Hymenolepis microstoma]